RALELLVGHVLERIAVLDLHLPRDQKRTDFHISRRLLLAHLFNRGRPVLFEVGSEGEQKILVERSTRSLQGTARVSWPATSLRRWPVSNNSLMAAQTGPPTLPSAFRAASRETRPLQ